MSTFDNSPHNGFVPDAPVQFADANLADAVAKSGQTDPGFQPLRLRQAVVQSVQASSVTIRIAGSTTDIAGVKSLQTLPAPGNTVWVAQLGPMLLVLGQQAGQSKPGGVGCVVTRTSSGGAVQSFANGSYTLVDLFDSEYNDDYGFHASNAQSLIVPTGLGGWYTISAYMEWTANGTGTRQCLILKNGNTVGNARINGNAADTVIVPASTVEYLNDGDTITLQGQQTSGGALTLSGGSYARLALARHN